MLSGLFGSLSAELVLMFLAVNEEAYPREIARRFGASLSSIQNALIRLEQGGVVVSRLRARARFYRFNPRFPFRRELRAMLLKALDYMPPSERERYAPERRRPRVPGKRS